MNRMLQTLRSKDFYIFAFHSLAWLARRCAGPRAASVCVRVYLFNVRTALSLVAITINSTSRRGGGPGLGDGGRWFRQLLEMSDLFSLFCARRSLNRRKLVFNCVLTTPATFLYFSCLPLENLLALARSAGRRRAHE